MGGGRLGQMVVADEKDMWVALIFSEAQSSSVGWSFFFQTSREVIFESISEILQETIAILSHYITFYIRRETITEIGSIFCEQKLAFRAGSRMTLCGALMLF